MRSDTYLFYKYPCDNSNSTIKCSEDYTKNYATDLTAVARAVTGGAEDDVKEVQQYQASLNNFFVSYFDSNIFLF